MAFGGLQARKVEPVSPDLASPAKRFVAYLIDDVLVGALVCGVLILLLELYGDSADTTPQWLMIAVNYVPLGFLINIWGFLLFPITWLTNGYTLGKKLMKIKVARLDGEKLTFWNALLRDGLLKGIVNLATLGLLNLASFIWLAGRPARVGVADAATKTRVVNEDATMVDFSRPMRY